MPIALAPVTADREGEAFPWRDVAERQAVRTDDRGAFTLPVVPAGSWLIGVAPEGTAGAGVAALPCTLACNAVTVLPGATANVALVAHRGLYVSGRTVDGDGLPLPSIEVGATHAAKRYRASARSAVDGAFRIGPLFPGDYDLRCGFKMEDPWALAATVRVAAGSDGLELTLRRGAGELAGRVVSLDSLPTAWVSLRHRDFAAAVATRADIDGSFAFAGLRPGLWDVKASTGHEAAVQLGVLVRADEQAFARLEMRHAGHLLVERTTPAPRGVQFEVLSADGVRFFDDTLAVAGAPGRCRIELPPGTYTVRLLSEERELGRHEVTVRAGETATVR